MNISQMLANQIREPGCFTGAARHFAATDRGVTVHCDVTNAERLGCALSRLEMLKESGKPLSDSLLLDHANRICGKVNYLLEPLKVVEFDRLTHTALVRSDKPRKKGELVSYYELLAAADAKTVLRRVGFDTATRKYRALDLVLTGDQLEQLIDDLANIVRETVSLN